MTTLREFIGSMAKDDGPMDFLDFEVRNSDTIWTSSAVKQWWLTKFRGYRVITVRQIPHPSAFGGIRYVRKWLMGKTQA